MLKTTVFTKNEELIKEIESLNKDVIECVHLNYIKNSKINIIDSDDFIEPVHLNDIEEPVHLNDIEDSKIIIIDSDNYMNIEDKYYYIQVLNPNDPHLNGLDSYIHTDDIKNTIIDLLYAMYGIGLISMDENDVMEVLRNKVFKYYRYELDNPIDESNSKSIISKLDLKNKNILVVNYGDKNLSLWEASYLLNEMHTQEHNELFIGSYIDESLGDKRIIAFILEENYSWKK